MSCSTNTLRNKSLLQISIRYTKGSPRNLIIINNRFYFKCNFFFTSRFELDEFHCVSQHACVAGSSFHMFFQFQRPLEKPKCWKAKTRVGTGAGGWGQTPINWNQPNPKSHRLLPLQQQQPQKRCREKTRREKQIINCCLLLLVVVVPSFFY